MKGKFCIGLLSLIIIANIGGLNAILGEEWGVSSNETFEFIFNTILDEEGNKESTWRDIEGNENSIVENDEFNIEIIAISDAPEIKFIFPDKNELITNETYIIGFTDWFDGRNSTPQRR